MHNTGQCHCGAVKYEIEGEPVRMAQCHCNACRRLTGTGHHVQAFFKNEQIKSTGETNPYASTTDTGNTRTVRVCANCGSLLFSENTRAPGVTAVAAGSLDNSDWFKPQIIVFAAERPVWDTIDPEIDAHDFM